MYQFTTMRSYRSGTDVVNWFKSSIGNLESLDNYFNYTTCQFGPPTTTYTTMFLSTTENSILDLNLQTISHYELQVDSIETPN